MSKKIDYIKERFLERFPEHDAKDFIKALKLYEELDTFAPNGNVNEVGGIGTESHFIMRTATQYYINKAFKAKEYKEYLNDIKEDPRFNELQYFKETNKASYVYLIESKDKFYVGARLTNKKPEEDIKHYLSSSKHKDIFLKDKNIQTTILKTFDNFRDALIAESYIHKKFNVKDNNLFWNEANQTPWGFEGINKKEVVSIDKKNNVIYYPSIASTGVYLDGTLLSPYTKQTDKGIRYMYKDEWENVKDYWKYEDYVFDAKEDSVRNIPIVRISKSGKLQEEYSSSSEAVRKTGLASINDAIQRIDTFFVGDSMWLTKEEYKDISDIKLFVRTYKLLRYIDKRQYTNIKQLNKNGDIIAVFDTVKEAKEETGAPEILAVLKGKQQTSGGYKWSADKVTDSLRENIRRAHYIDLDVKKAFINRFGKIDGYYRAKKIYENTKSFAPNGNISDTNVGKDWDAKVHFIMRWTVGNYITEAFKAMKIDMNDDNVTQNMKEGNIGTPQRIAKVWCGYSDDDDTELGGGRWRKEPRLASFPNTHKKSMPITKRVDIISNCSHHFIPFSTITRQDSYAVISYIPKKKLIGISKLQRVANFIAQRFWLQEDLTKAIYDTVKEAAETDSVYVKIVNAVHGCESFRGAKANDGAFTSEYYGGKFEDVTIRESIIGK